MIKLVDFIRQNKDPLHFTFQSIKTEKVKEDRAVLSRKSMLVITPFLLLNLETTG